MEGFKKLFVFFFCCVAYVAKEQKMKLGFEDSLKLFNYVIVSNFHISNLHLCLFVVFALWFLIWCLWYIFHICINKKQSLGWRRTLSSLIMFWFPMFTTLISTFVCLSFPTFVRLSFHTFVFGLVFVIWFTSLLKALVMNKLDFVTFLPRQKGSWGGCGCVKQTNN